MGGARAGSTVTPPNFRVMQLMIAQDSLLVPQRSNASASTSTLAPSTPHELAAGFGADDSSFYHDWLVDKDGDNLTALPVSVFCKSCKKSLLESEFDCGKKTCRTCLLTHRDHMRRKRRKLREKEGLESKKSATAVGKNKISEAHDYPFLARSESRRPSKIPTDVAPQKKGCFSG